MTNITQEQLEKICERLFVKHATDVGDYWANDTAITDINIADFAKDLLNEVGVKVERN